jgi:hypothetical protein
MVLHSIRLLSITYVYAANVDWDAVGTLLTVFLVVIPSIGQYSTADSRGTGQGVILCSRL